jgi:hypothetical protein
VLPSGQKLTLGLLATIFLEAVTLRAYAPFPALLNFFKCILDVVFCEGIQYRLRLRFDHFNSVKMAVFQFYLPSWKQRKVGWVGDESHVVFS